MLKILMAAFLILLEVLLEAAILWIIGNVIVSLLSIHFSFTFAYAMAIALIAMVLRNLF